MEGLEPHRNANDADLLRAFIAGRDVPCPVCQYNIRDLQHGTCPECGSDLRLQVGSAVPRFAWFVLLASPLLGTIGIGILFVVLIAADRGRPPKSWGLTVIESLALFDILGCHLIYKFYPRIARHHTGVKLLLFLVLLAAHVSILTLSMKFGIR
jgi:hypothetical protein